MEEARYVRAVLEAHGETGWEEVSTEEPGTLTLQNAGGEQFQWEFRFNGGNPKWFLQASPKRLWAKDIVDALSVSFGCGCPLSVSHDNRRSSRLGRFILLGAEGIPLGLRGSY